MHTVGHLRVEVGDTRGQRLQALGCPGVDCFLQSSVVCGHQHGPLTTSYMYAKLVMDRIVPDQHPTSYTRLSIPWSSPFS